MLLFGVVVFEGFLNNGKAIAIIDDSGYAQMLEAALKDGIEVKVNKKKKITNIFGKEETLEFIETEIVRFENEEEMLDFMQKKLHLEYIKLEDRNGYEN